MPILSVDLAYKDYRDIGAVVLEAYGKDIRYRLLPVQLEGHPSPAQLARYLDSFCEGEGIRILLLDGPQAWKSQHNGLAHSRLCERELNTPAKTGEPFTVLPRNYLGFVNFAIETNDALAELGWSRLSDRNGTIPGRRVIVESFPLSAWRTLGLKSLPAKRRARANDIAGCFAALREVFPLVLHHGLPNHDQLQAIVSGLAGIALEAGEYDACLFAGSQPVMEADFWREGWIVNRKLP